MPDELGRPLLSDGIRASIREELALIPAGRRGALLVVGTEQGARIHLAARIGEGWKIAGGAGWEMGETRPTGYVAAEYTW